MVRNAVIAGIAGLALLMGLVAYFMYNKPHADMHRAASDFTMTSQELFAAFESDEAAANQKYLDKVLQVTGEVLETSTDEEGLVTVNLDGGGMMFGVICKLDPLSDPARTTFPSGAEVTFKGICTGMLMDVVLVRCVEVRR